MRSRRRSSPPGCAPRDRSWLNERTDAGWETHLTRRDVRRLALVVPSDGVAYVCENPRVLEAAIDAGLRPAVVCTMGSPTVVVTTLVEQLRALGAQLHYHGDFDWPGIAIANVLIGSHQCRPWRLAAADYTAALARLAPVVTELPRLGATPTPAVWDAALTEEMSRAGRAIHEELVLTDLLTDLQGCATSR